MLVVYQGVKKLRILLSTSQREKNGEGGVGGLPVQGQGRMTPNRLRGSGKMFQLGWGGG